MAVDHLKQGQKLVNSTLALPGVVELKQKQNSQTMPHVLFLWSSCKARLMFWTWNNRSLDKRSCDGRAHQIATKGHCSKIEMVKVLSQTSYILFPPLQCSTSFWHLFWHSFWHIFAVEGTLISQNRGRGPAWNTDITVFWDNCCAHRDDCGSLCTYDIELLVGSEILSLDWPVVEAAMMAYWWLAIETECRSSAQSCWSILICNFFCWRLLGYVPGGAPFSQLKRCQRRYGHKHQMIFYSWCRARSKALTVTKTSSFL